MHQLNEVVTRLAKTGQAVQYLDSISLFSLEAQGLCAPLSHLVQVPTPWHA